jgi:hypothetical protein
MVTGGICTLPSFVAYHQHLFLTEVCFFEMPISEEDFVVSDDEGNYGYITKTQKERDRAKQVALRGGIQQTIFLDSLETRT